jgi:YggT family protein
MWAIIIRAILSWFPISPSNPIIVILSYITEPIIAPLRRIVPRIGMVDLTPFVAIVILMIITWLLNRLVL